MDAEKQIVKDLSPQQENFVEVENHCCLCGTELMFEHSQDDQGLKIKEQATCPCCKIMLKEKEHHVH